MNPGQLTDSKEICMKRFLPSSPNTIKATIDLLPLKGTINGNSYRKAPSVYSNTASSTQELNKTTELSGTGALFKLFLFFCIVDYIRSR